MVPLPAAVEVVDGGPRVRHRIAVDAVGRCQSRPPAPARRRRRNIHLAKSPRRPFTRPFKRPLGRSSNGPRGGPLRRLPDGRRCVSNGILFPTGAGLGGSQSGTADLSRTACIASHRDKEDFNPLKLDMIEKESTWKSCAKWSSRSSGPKVPRKYRSEASSWGAGVGSAVPRLARIGNWLHGQMGK
ncbi:hypothetical protein M885DRAFT_531190 [Pelagophyceae sp. CCMP2097]|nr:hypothetical protein M885DRAFT_531190 [Pelagophyceae sp. CCMP2097]